MNLHHQGLVAILSRCVSQVVVGIKPAHGDQNASPDCKPTLSWFAQIEALGSSDSRDFG